MACGCSRSKSAVKYLWTSADGQTTMEYATEIEAKAKTIRKGGTYKPVPR